MIKIESNAFTPVNKTSKNGIDERYPTNDSNCEDDFIIAKISELLRKKELLNILQDEKVSTFYKLELLKDNSIYSMNLNAGGLMDDFLY